MKPNNFIFADLSTYTPKETMAFYESVFGWTYYEADGYYSAYKDEQEICGLYETPEKFKQMRMPHFWMSYIQVNNVTQTVEKARELGGIIEVVDKSTLGKVALIRDPQGSGFTVYEGDQLTHTRTLNEPGTLIWNELHVSNAAKVIPFYEGIFNWTFNDQGYGTYNIQNHQGEQVADLMEIPNNFKGKYEYWVCSFGVENLAKTQDKILNLGGSVVSDEGDRILMTDNSGEAFFYVREV
ncbi:VOC family protein [Flagellimonas algicola]|uniref:VOC family protein n=1 Tax=Flagellimonas algicola TaxID=2583815 RepID=A0ABY2WHE2_9FLAO|nr:VOC family protein [Allomuricauda algicola]TMU51002.1 VOC family protein [Allomuricauda algicola]